MAGDLSLPVALRQIVGAARDLLGARYAAIGVQGRDGALEQFVHSGEHTAQLGFTPGISFAGELDPGPDESLAHDIVAVTREALSNCARHARATTVSISLARQDGLITLTVTDNGRGLGTPARSSGLASMRRRAERKGRTLQLTSPSGGGTRLTWTARTSGGPGG